MIVLGVGNMHHDPSAVILIDGKLVAGVEQERFSRNKHATGEYPVDAIQYCLKQAGLQASDIQVVAHSTSTEAYDRNKWKYFKRAIWKRPSQAIKAITKATHRKKTFKETPRKALRAAGIDPDKVEMHYVEHHVSHAASAVHFSGYEKTAFITMDGSGEFTSTLLGYYENGKIEIIKEFCVPDSLGFFYATMTDYLGFQHDDGEYKVMGMAPFGDASKINLDDLISYKNKSFHINDDYIYATRRKRHMPDKWYSKKMIEKFGPPREGDALKEPYIHIAAATQKKLEEITMKLIEDYLEEPLRKSGGKLCFAGGCALNVVLNNKIIQHPWVKELWVQPASGDGGLSLGAASQVAVAKGDRIEEMKHCYYGPAYTNAEAEAVFGQTKHKIERPASITDAVSDLLAAGKVVAWCQGRMEWGPRALGNRSILGNPKVKGTADKINEIIKFRETWRPFCPSMMKEFGPQILETDHDSPFMTFCFKVRDEWKDKIPEVVHVDGTARPQLVTKETNPRYYELIEKFYQKTGMPVIINTSLNRRGEPMVCSPEDALRMFEGSGLEYIAVEDLLISKVE